jgi:signal transduction histidine kinase
MFTFACSIPGRAFARRSTEAHGGTIRARNRPGGGLAVEIVLPLRANLGAVQNG